MFKATSLINDQIKTSLRIRFVSFGFPEFEYQKQFSFTMKQPVNQANVKNSKSIR